VNYRRMHKVQPIGAGCMRIDNGCGQMLRQWQNALPVSGQESRICRRQCGSVTLARPVGLRRASVRPGHVFLAPLTIEPTSTTVFSGGAVAHVFAAHPQ
jgi:hypothetical protein